MGMEDKNIERTWKWTELQKYSFLEVVLKLEDLFLHMKGSGRKHQPGGKTIYMYPPSARKHSGSHLDLRPRRGLSREGSWRRRWIHVHSLKMSMVYLAHWFHIVSQSWALHNRDHMSENPMEGPDNLKLMVLLNIMFPRLIMQGLRTSFHLYLIPFFMCLFLQKTQFLVLAHFSVTVIKTMMTKSNFEKKGFACLILLYHSP